MYLHKLVNFLLHKLRLLNRKKSSQRTTECDLTLNSSWLKSDFGSLILKVFLMTYNTLFILLTEDKFCDKFYTEYRIHLLKINMLLNVKVRFFHVT